MQGPGKGESTTYDQYYNFGNTFEIAKLLGVAPLQPSSSSGIRPLTPEEYVDEMEKNVAEKLRHNFGLSIQATYHHCVRICVSSDCTEKTSMQKIVATIHDLQRKFGMPPEFVADHLQGRWVTTVHR